MSTKALFSLFLLAAAGLAEAQISPAGAWAASLTAKFSLTPNITYGTANGHENKLDVWALRDRSTTHPVVVFIHGGGWVGGSKESVQLQFLPYLEMGFHVVNVEYRLAPVSLAPAAVEDCRCALRWVFHNAEAYKFDTSRVIVTGGSAGGHLSLATGMLNEQAGFDRQCFAKEPIGKVAAIVNWYGITDINDLLEGANQKEYAVRWFGSLPDRDALARRLSPLSLVRSDLPAILTIHGDADPTVPYQHAVRLHKALEEQKVPNQLVTVPGGKHGGFTAEEYVRIHTEIRAFLGKHLQRR
jgi:acetyl esterase/lipase